MVMSWEGVVVALLFESLPIQSQRDSFQNGVEVAPLDLENGGLLTVATKAQALITKGLIVVDGHGDGTVAKPRHLGHQDCL